MAKPGKLIKQHYQGGAKNGQKFTSNPRLWTFLQLRVFICVCVCTCMSDKCLNCTIGHKNIWCPRVLDPFHGNPAGHVREPKDQSSHLSSRLPRTGRRELKWHEWVTWPRTRGLSAEECGLWRAIKTSRPCAAPTFLNDWQINGDWQSKQFRLWWMRVCWRVELSWWSKDAVSMRRDLQRLISQSNSLISPCQVIFLYSSLVESFSGYQPTPPSPLSSPVAVETREWVTHPPPFYSSWQGQHEDRTLWQDNLCHILPQSFYRSVCHVMMIMHRETPVAVRQMRDGFHRSR